MDDEDIEMARRELREISAKITEYAKKDDTAHSESRARIQALEQIVVSLDSYNGRGSGGSLPAAGLGGLAVHELTQAQAYSHLAAGNAGTCRVQLAAGIRNALTNEGYGSSSDGSIPSAPERSGFAVQAQRPLRLLDFLRSRPTTADSVEHVRLTASGDAGEQIGEGTLKPLVDIDGTLVKAQIATIAAFTSASKQVLNDHGALQAAVDLMIRQKLLDRLEHQLINGPGGLGEIHGLLPLATPFVPTVSPVVDQIGEALASQAASGYTQNLVLVNPADWFAVTASKATDNSYLFGSPTTQLRPALWGSPLVTSSSIAAGTALIVDLTRVTVLDREQPSVMVSNSHEDYFRRNLIAILGELRAGLEVSDVWGVVKLDLLAS